MATSDSVENLIIPSEYRYTNRHIWLGTEGPGRRFCLVGVTEIIARRLAKAREVQLPAGIVKARRGEIVGRIAGISAFDQRRVTIPIYCPIAGIINPANDVFRRRFLRRARPELVQTDPYDTGWLMALLAESSEEIEGLMDSDAYRSYLSQLTRSDPTALYRFEDSALAASNPTRVKGIFICYRRADSSDWAQRLAKRIDRYYGALGIYMDIASIPLGRDYRQVIENYLKKVDVVVVLIGPNFFLVTNDSGQPRIALEDDPVRMEIRAALEHDKIVCPLLVGGAREPKLSDFPEDLRELGYRQRSRIASESDLDEFVTSLRPDLLRVDASEDRVGDRHEIPGGWDTWRDNQSDFPRQRTAITQQLFAMGWLLDPRVGEGNLGHADFPQYRIRFDEVFAWFEERRRGFWGRMNWRPVYGFPVSSEGKVLSLPQGLKQAAANPDAFLDEHGRL